MPLLLRAAHVDEVPPGTTHDVRLRGRRIRLANEGGRFSAAEVAGPLRRLLGKASARRYRVEVRGNQLWVGLDPDPEEAPATMQKMSPSPDAPPPNGR